MSFKPGHPVSDDTKVDVLEIVWDQTGNAAEDLVWDALTARRANRIPDLVAEQIEELIAEL